MGNTISLYSNLVSIFVSAMHKNKYNVNKNLMLIIAINRQAVDVVDYLTRNGADVDNPIKSRRLKECCTPLIMASKIGNDEIVNILIFRGASVNRYLDGLDTTPLHIASAYGNTKIVEILLEHGADPNARDINGCTPLHIAITKQSEMLELIKLLLDNGADINVADKEGNTPLDMCFLKGFPYRTKELILSYFII